MTIANPLERMGRQFLGFRLLALTAALVSVTLSINVDAQDLGRSLTTPTPLSPPTPLEAGPALPPSGNSQLTPPVSIGPAPGAYPPPNSYPFGSRSYGPPPYYLGPAIAPPGYYGQNPVRPLGPTPYNSNFGSSFLDQHSTRRTIETRMPTGASEAPVPIPVRDPIGPINFRLAISETFLNRLIAREDVKPGPIRDVILGAQVTGRQTTVSKLRVDLTPSQTNAHAVFVLNGDVQTLTTGVTPQAAIDTVGQQQFVALKDVFFDGHLFSTRHATVFIRANNKTVGAMTPLTGTIFGGLAERIAYRAAERQKEAGEAVARDRLAEKVYPTFDGEVDAQLSKANRALSGVVKSQLEAVKMMPTSQFARTTDTHFYYEGLIGSSDKLASIPASYESSADGIRITVHESLLNTIVNRAGLKGLKTTDKQLKALEAPFMADPEETSSDNDNDRSSPSIALPMLPTGTDGFSTDIEFDEEEPLTVQLENDRLILTVIATFKPAGQSLLPAMTVTIPYQTKIVGSKIRLTAGKPRVAARDKANPDAAPTIVESMIQNMIQAELVPLEIDRTLPAALWPSNSPPPQITSIRSENGWATIVVE